MFTTGLVVLALVAMSCGDLGMTLEEADQTVVDSLNKLKALAAEQVHEWPESYSEMFGLPEDDETASPEPHVPKEDCHSAVWRVVLVLAVLMLAVLGVMGTVYYLCVWRGGRMHYQQQKDVAT